MVFGWDTRWYSASQNRPRKTAQSTKRHTSRQPCAEPPACHAVCLLLRGGRASGPPSPPRVALRAKPLRPLECNPAGDGLRGAVARAKRRSCKTRAVASQPSSAALPPSESHPSCSDRRGPRCARQATGPASTAAQTTAFAHALRRGGGSACPLAFAALTSRPAAPVASATSGRVRMARLSRCPRARPGRAGAALRAVTHIPRPGRNASTDAVASPLRLRLRCEPPPTVPA